MALPNFTAFRRLVVVSALLVGGLSACGGDLPTFPPYPRDLGIECTSTSSMPTPDASPGPSMSSGCAMGEVCLQGHCYSSCTADTQCAASEQCTRGACVARSTPRPDMGPVDSGAPDPCAAVTCTDVALPFCYPRTGGCVQCRTSDDCGSATPVCDVAYGVCRAFVPGPCAPCKLDVDCNGTIGSFATRCLQRDRPFERVCVARCAMDGSCPQGMTCNATNECLPRQGTCTTFFAASQRRACAGDAECAPLGSTTSDFLYPGSCRASACASPCGTSADCFDVAQTCDATFFCAP